MLFYKVRKNNRLLLILGCVIFVVVLTILLNINIKYRNGLWSSLEVTTLKIYTNLLPEQAKQLRKQDLINLTVNQEGRLGLWLRVVGIERLIAEYKNLFPNQSLIVCHKDAHTLGRLLYQNDGPEAFKHSSGWCNSGIIHGVVDEFINDRGFSLIEIKKTCFELESENKIAECIHGAGHGLLAYEDYNLDKAIEDCKDIRVNSNLSEACYQGVFMENYLASLSGNDAHQVKFVSSDIDYPCSIVEKSGLVQTACTASQIARIFTFSDKNFDQVVDYCETRDDELREVCFFSLGFHASAFLMTSDLEKLLQGCNCTGEDKTDFLQGLVRVWLKNGMEYSSSGQLCHTSNNEDKKACYESLSLMAEDYYRDDPEILKNICSKAEEGYRDYCLGV